MKVDKEGLQKRKIPENKNIIFIFGNYIGFDPE